MRRNKKVNGNFGTELKEQIYRLLFIEITKLFTEIITENFQT
jgi:hypothetical protein